MRIGLGWVMVLLVGWAGNVVAHPMVEGVIDVTVGRQKIVVDARVSMEQVLVAVVGNGARPQKEQWLELVRGHGAYLVRHLKVTVDGAEAAGRAVGDGAVVGELKDTGQARYRLEYAPAKEPGVVRIDQNLLREFENWSVSLVVRIRQEGQAYETGLLTSDKTVEFGCEWAAAPASREVKTGVKQIVLDYLMGGIKHILRGYDHLLFVSALVLAATGFWDLIKVVSAFTLAHTVTLTLAVFNVVRVSEHVVEPMIAASIVFVAVQNVFWPRRSRGWERLAIAFGFGLFHGLGFAGGLRDAMEKFPATTVWAALIAFSIGVELGHQIVVVPLFGVLSAVRHVGAEAPRVVLMRRVVKVGSGLISVAGAYFLVMAFRGWG